MKTFMRLVAPAVIAFGVTTEAAAIFDVQFMAGRRTGTWTHRAAAVNVEKDASIDELQVGFHLDPIPLVPISFGLSIDIDNYSSPETHGFTVLHGISLQPEIQVWWPLGDLKPYARVGYAIDALKGTATNTTTATPAEYDVILGGTGVHVGLGVKYNVIPFLALLVEYNLGFEKVKTQTADAGGVDLKDSYPAFDFNTNAFLIGVQLGL